MNDGWPKYYSDGTQRAGHAIEDGHTYFVRVAHRWVGDCALWLCPDGHGHTMDLAKAGEFSAEEARRHTSRETDIPYRADLVRAVVVVHVAINSLCEIDLQAREARGVPQNTTDGTDNG